MKWVETHGRKPRTGERRLKVMFRCGTESRFDYTAAQLRWTQTGDSHDVVAVCPADRAASVAAWNPVSGGY